MSDTADFVEPSIPPGRTLREGRSPLMWNVLDAVESLLHVQFDRDQVAHFQELFAAENLPLETTLALIETNLDPAQLLSSAQRLVAMHPRDINCLRVLALAFGANSQIPFAIASAQRASRIAPHENKVSEELAHWQRFAGSLLQNTSWLTKSALVFDELAEREPMHCDYPFQAGLLKHDLRLYKQAEASFNQAIARFPPHARAYRCRGDSIREQGRSVEAQTSYMKAAELFLMHARQSLPIRAEILFNEAADSFSAAAGVGLPRAALMSHLAKLNAARQQYLECGVTSI